MKKVLLVLTVVLLTAAAASAQTAKTAATPDDAALQKLTKTLESYGKDPVLVREVKAQNALNMSSADINAIDKAWMAGGEADRVTRLQTNPCAKRLKEILASHPALNESFAMDGKGANVCMTGKTSDFWQGDEAKWQKSFNGGKGSVFTDAPKYDTSAKAILVQVSVPVVDGGVAIGAITFGVNTKLLGN